MDRIDAGSLRRRHAASDRAGSGGRGLQPRATHLGTSRAATARDAARSRRISASDPRAPEGASTMNVVFCWSDISGYMAACWRALAAIEDVRLFVIAFEVGSGEKSI